MSKRYPMEIITASKNLYLQDHSLRDIAEEISKVTGRKASAALVFKWAAKGHWAEEKDALEAKAMARVAEETAELRAEAMADTVRNQVAAYRSLWERGLDELRDMAITRPSDSWSWASNTISNLTFGDVD